MQTIQTKVLIIGAGPTGLMMACQLVRHGVDFIIIDKKEGITKESKALGVQARTMEVYQQMGIAQEAVRRGQIGEAVNMIVKGKAVERIHLAAIGEGLSPFPYIHILEQSENEALLSQFLQTENKTVNWNTSLDSFTQTETEVEAIVIDEKGDRLTIMADWLVGADGGRSLVRHGLGMAFKGETHEQTFFVADTQVDWDFGYEELYICLDKKDFLAFFPMKGTNRFRIVGALPAHLEDVEGLKFEDFIGTIVKTMSFSLKVSNTDWFKTYKIHHRVVPDFQRGRCFLAGDSAHIHSPAGGQGMNTGLLDAYNLAWKLALVIQEKANKSLLKTYTEERLPFAEELVRTTDTAFGMIVSDNPLVSFARMNILPTFFKMGASFPKIRAFAFKRVSQIGINYRDYSINRESKTGDFESHSPEAGDRFPYIQVGESDSFSWLKGTTFHAMYFYTEKKGQTLRTLDNYIDLLNLDIQLHLFGKEEYAAYFEALGIPEEALLIVRPDMYIGYRSGVVELQDLEVYFNRLLGGVVS